MTESLLIRLLRRIGRCIAVRPVTVLGIVIVVSAFSLAICLSREPCQQATVTFLVRIVEPGGSAPGQSPEPVSPETWVASANRWVCGEAVLARMALLMQLPDCASVVEWRRARSAWNAEHSQENWNSLERALQHLDQEIERCRRDSMGGAAFAARCAELSQRIHLGAGSSAGLPPGMLTLSVAWPVRSGDASQIAETLAEMVEDRVEEVQMRAGREAAESIRLRREALKETQLAPSEKALRDFITHDLDSRADVVDLEQMSRSVTEADLSLAVRRLRQDLAAIDSQQAEARRLRAELLESLPAALWNGAARRDSSGELSGPDVARMESKQLPDEDPILRDLTVIIPAEILEKNVVLGKLKAREGELLIELNRLRSEFNLSYQGTADTQAELARTRRQILIQVAGEAAQLQVGIAAMEARRQELQQRLEDAQGRVEKLTPKVARYQQLCYEVDVARKQYLKSWMDETETLKLQERGMPLTVLEVVDRSVDSSAVRSFWSRPWACGVLAGGVGAVLAIAYALVAGMLDRTLRWPDQLEREVGLPVVGRIGRLEQAIVS